MITIKNTKGDILKQLPNDINQTLLAQLADNDIFIDASCYSGACSACSCKITEGIDLINKEKMGEVYVEPEEGSVLTCIAGLDSKDTNITLEVQD